MCIIFVKLTKYAFMEKKGNINQKDTSIELGFFIKLECCTCGKEHVICGTTKKEVVENASNEGWQTLNSDKFMLIGHWCGCNYMS